jgi:hypothetical protein
MTDPKSAVGEAGTVVSQPLAWLLVERWRNGSWPIVGIALTNEAASAWVLRNDEVGHARTSLPVPIIGLPVAPVPRQPPVNQPCQAPNPKGGRCWLARGHDGPHDFEAAAPVLDRREPAS